MTRRVPYSAVEKTRLLIASEKDYNLKETKNLWREIVKSCEFLGFTVTVLGIVFLVILGLGPSSSSVNISFGYAVPLFIIGTVMLAVGPGILLLKRLSKKIVVSYFVISLSLASGFIFYAFQPGLTPTPHIPRETCSK